MKNKSKLKKIKENKQGQAKCPAQWLFLSRQEIRVRDIKDALEENEAVSLEIWDAAGVLEVTLSDGKTIDVEETEMDLRDDYSNDFLQSNHTRSLFYVTVYPDSFSLAKPVMEEIAGKMDGLFCGDTDDFTPVVS